MSCRIIPFSFLAACLVFVAVALWLPSEVASRHQADADPEPPTSTSKLIAGECALFVTFRPADFTGDELVKTLLQDLPKSLEQEMHVSAYGIERLTVAVVRQGAVQIVRTKKAYDADKLRESLTARYGRTTTRFSDKDKARGEDAPPKPAFNEKKAGGKKIYYVGEINRYTQGWCPIDKNTFMAGTVAAIATLLDTKGKPSAEMTEALGLSSRHSLVLALDGKRLRTMVKQQREDNERERREWEKKREDRFKERFKDVPKDSERDKDAPKDKASLSRDRKSSPREIFVSAQIRVAAEAKPKDDGDDVDLLFDMRREGMVFLPYKPLSSVEFGLLTLDIKKTYTATAKLTFANKAQMDDGETALKSFLYVGRELAVMLPKSEREFGGMKPLSGPIKKAFADAKVERKGTTLSATLTMTPEAGLAKKLREGIEEERKNRMNRFGEKDKRAVPYDKTTDKARFDKG